MVIVKEVKLVSNDRRKNVVVQYLESVPTIDSPTVLKAQRESTLPFEEALKQVGTGLNGLIIKAPCKPYQAEMEKQNNLHDWISFETRYVYVEQGDDVTNLYGPILSQAEIDAQSDTNWIWEKFNLKSNQDEE